LSHFSISHLFVNILLKYQYVTHFSITIYRPWVKGFERGICREVGQWEVSRGAIAESRVSKSPVSSKHHQRVSSKSMTKEHHQRVSSKHHQRVSSKSMTKEHHQRVSSKSMTKEHHQRSRQSIINESLQRASSKSMTKEHDQRASSQTIIIKSLSQSLVKNHHQKPTNIKNKKYKNKHNDI